MCKYCAAKLDVDGETFIGADDLEPIVNKRWGDLGLEISLHDRRLFINIDIYDESDDACMWKSEITPINYCPMCGRKLKC